MTRLLTRRSLLHAGLGAAIVGGVAACGVGGQQGGTEGRLRATWWGNDSQSQALNGAFDAFAEARDIEITREALPWDGYWDKLATVTAAGNAPDLVMQAGSQIPDYAARGALADLNSVSQLDTSVVDEGLRNFGAVDDELFGVVAAANAMGLVVNPDLASQAGLTVPSGPWEWTALVELANAAHESLGGEVWGVTDSGGDLISFIMYLRMTGQELYEDDGALTSVEEQIHEWFMMWDELRKSGGAPPADVTAETGATAPDGPMAQQQVVMSLAWTQDYTSLASVSADTEWSIHLPPYAEQNPSLWMNAASLWSISATSGDIDGTGELINYLLTDDAAIQTIGLALGTPPSAHARDLLSGSLERADQNINDYMNVVAETSKPLNRLWPAGFVALRERTGELNEAVAFGELSVDAAVEEFLKTAAQG